MEQLQALFCRKLFCKSLHLSVCHGREQGLLNLGKLFTGIAFLWGRGIPGFSGIVKARGCYSFLADRLVIMTSWRPFNFHPSWLVGEGIEGVGKQKGSDNEFLGGADSGTRGVERCRVLVVIIGAGGVGGHGERAKKVRVCVCVMIHALGT